MLSLVRYRILSLKQIGELFSMDYAAVSQAVKRFEIEMEKNKIAAAMRGKTMEILKKAEC